MSGSCDFNAPQTGDEIDLLELAKSLWAQKLLIILVTLAVAIAAAAYAFLSQPVYQTKSSLLPPRVSDITGYNLGREEAKLAKFKVADVYSVFLRNLGSETLRRSFFQEVYIPSLTDDDKTAAQDRLWETFSRVLTVKAPEVKIRPEYFEVSVTHENPQLAAEWVNLFVQRAAIHAQADMQRNTLSEIDTRIQSIQRRIDVLRATALKQREDRIARLQEALIVAEAVGKDAPEVTSGRTSSDGELSAFVDGSLMYMRGANAIRAELEVLQARKSDDPFIAELRGLQSQFEFLKGIDIKPDNVAVFTLDSSAEVPETPIKPKKPLVLALGIVLGGMLGVFIALVRSMLSRKSAAPAA